MKEYPWDAERENTMAGQSVLVFCFFSQDKKRYVTHNDFRSVNDSSVLFHFSDALLNTGEENLPSMNTIKIFVQA